MTLPRQVRSGFDGPERLGASVAEPKAGDDLVEDQQRLLAGRDAAQLLKNPFLG